MAEGAADPGWEGRTEGLQMRKMEAFDKTGWWEEGFPGGASSK